MKFRYLFIVVTNFISSALVASPKVTSEETSYDKQSVKESLSTDNPSLFQKVRVLPYVHMEFIVPGAGVAIRLPRENIEFEANFKTVLFPFDIWGSSSWINVNFASLSFMPILKKTEEGQFYIGGGGGTYFGEDIYGPRMLIPIFAGYEGKKVFLDLGVDLIQVEQENFGLFPIPTFRMGMNF